MMKWRPAMWGTLTGLLALGGAGCALETDAMVGRRADGGPAADAVPGPRNGGGADAARDCPEGCERDATPRAADAGPAATPPDVGVVPPDAARAVEDAAIGDEPPDGGEVNACPMAAVATPEPVVGPDEVVILDGSSSSDPEGDPLRYTWRVIGPDAERRLGPPPIVEAFANPRRPTDGGAPDDEDTPQAMLWMSAATTYVVELRVDDGQHHGGEGCPADTARVVVAAVPETGIYIDLTWQSPADTDGTGPDLDLHLLHPSAGQWNTAPSDCYFGNPQPDWGEPGDPADDPSLSIDDVNGVGPEVIVYEQPAETVELGPYRVGVHQFRAESRRDGFRRHLGPSDARLRIFVNGALAWDHTDDDAAGRKRLQDNDEFWEAAAIHWPPERVVTLDRLHDGIPQRRDP